MRAEMEQTAQAPLVAPGSAGTGRRVSDGRDMWKLFDSGLYRRQWERVRRFGVAKTLLYWLNLAVNKIVYFDRLRIIVLEREDVKAFDAAQAARFSSRFATYEDLVAMQAQGTWAVDEGNLTAFKAGDRCLLSYVDGALAGYTWAHTQGRPQLMPGLRLSVPEPYVYNFAAFTAPAFRGYGIQGYRHHALMESEALRGKRGLLGYVKYTNWSSRQGQSKSGYRAIGTLWMLGTRKHFYVGVPRKLRRLGIGRLK
jgi:hypothetical protein